MEERRYTSKPASHRFRVQLGPSAKGLDAVPSGPLLQMAWVPHALEPGFQKGGVIAPKPS